MQLLYNYTTSTAPTLASQFGNTSSGLLRHKAVETSFEYPFHSHALLASSAVHLFFQDRGKRQYFSRSFWIVHTRRV